MNYYPQTEYWRPLVPNIESVNKITNPYLNISRAPSVAENEREFVLVF